MSDNKFIMDEFGNLSRVPKFKRRKRCVICNELTHSAQRMEYQLPKSNKYIKGLHCEVCAEKQQKLWEEETEWHSQPTESSASDASDATT